MHRCSGCGQAHESKYDKLVGHVFVWTFLTVSVWGCALGQAEWSMAWWKERLSLVEVFSVVTVVAAYFWVQFLRERRRRQIGAH